MNSQITARRTDALATLAGPWEMVASAGGQPLAKAWVTFRWIEGGAFLSGHGQAAPPLPGTPPQWLANSPFPTTAIIGLDDATGDFSFLHADARGVHRVYRMTLDERRWTLHGATADGSRQRFTGMLEPGRITARWESCVDGQGWQHDFDETYTKLASADLGG
jgi:hypothetical protein